VKGDTAIIVALNEVLTAELTAINQYFVHYKMCEDWGYERLAKKKREESIEEMGHANSIIGRILYLEGIPNMQRLSPIRIGENAIEQHKLDLAVEVDAVDRLNKAIALCREKGDNGTRELLEGVLADEEESVDWHEAQLHIVEEIGKEKYLAEQIHG
jgi:bacterioferritin